VLPLPTFKIDTADGLRELNNHLATNAYLQGFQKTQDDLVVYLQFPRVPDIDRKQYPHVSRWFKNIDAFSPKDQNKWPALKAKPTDIAPPASASASSSSSAPQSARAKDQEPANVQNHQEEKQQSKKDKKQNKKDKK